MAATDTFASLASGLDAPAVGGEAVTPSDTIGFTTESRALYIGAGGNLTVVMASGVTLTFYGVPAGSLLPIRAILVKLTGTTASNIVALY